MNLIVPLALLLLQTPPIPEKKKDCQDSLDVAIFTSPRRAQTRQTLSIMVASETDFPDGKIFARRPGGSIEELPAWQSSGEPYGWVSRVDAPEAGTWRVVLATGTTVHACQTVYVRKRAGRAPSLRREPAEERWSQRAERRQTERHAAAGAAGGLRWAGTR